MFVPVSEYACGDLLLAWSFPLNSKLILRQIPTILGTEDCCLGELVVVFHCDFMLLISRLNLTS